MRKLPNIPTEVYEGGVSETHLPIKMPLCSTHSRDNWMQHAGYTYNGDGTISCQSCSFGAKINTGLFRVVNGRVVDLRNANSQ